ncbi:MAG: hypothetical protein NTX03_06545 [Bacteroidetes bacterium]|nr:hypothetical protein [Bacteroidota bacterium]
MKKLSIVALSLIMGLAISTASFAGGKGDKKACKDKKECCKGSKNEEKHCKDKKGSKCCKDKEAGVEKDSKTNNKDIKKAN